MIILQETDYQLSNKKKQTVAVKLGLHFYSGGESSGSGSQSSSSNSTGTGSSTSSAQLTPQQVLTMYGSALPSLTNTTTNAANGTAAGTATNAAANGATQAVNAVNLNGLSPGEAAATERSLNQTNTGTGNLGLLNPTNTISNAMNFGGAFNNKVGIMNNATNAASTAGNAANNTASTTASMFNPISSNANTANSVFKSANNSSASGSGSSANQGVNVGCFITTVCCKFKGLKDDCYELMTLRKFRDDHVDKRLVEEYYKIAPALAKKIEGNKVALEYCWSTIKDCINYIEEEKWGHAINRYKLMVDTLKHIL